MFFLSSIVDQLMTWILIVSALCSSSQVLREPFLFNEHASTLYLLLAINAGRYAFKTAQELLTADRAPTWYIQVIHHVVALLSFSVMAVCREDAVLGVVCILMEAHTVFFDVAYVMRKIDIPRHSHCHMVVASLGCSACVSVRALLPVTLLAVAVAMHSPLRMSPVPLSVLFTSVIFFALVNVWTVRQAVVALLRCVRARQICHLEAALQVKRCPPADVLAAKSACNALSNNDVVTFLKNELHAGEIRKPACANANVATAFCNKDGYKTRIDDILLEVTCVDAAGVSDGARTNQLDPTQADETTTIHREQVPTKRTDQMATIRRDQVSTTLTGQVATIRVDDVPTIRTKLEQP